MHLFWHIWGVVGIFILVHLRALGGLTLADFKVVGTYILTLRSKMSNFPNFYIFFHFPCLKLLKNILELPLKNFNFEKHS